MNQATFEKERKLNCEKAILILSIISLIASVLSIVFYMAVHVSISPIAWISRFVPPILLLIYTLKFFKKSKATLLVPIVFGLLAASSLWAIIEGFVLFTSYTGSNLIIELVTVITFSLATVSALKGLSNKLFIIIPTAFGLFLNLISLLNNIGDIELYVEYGWPVEYLFGGIAVVIAAGTFNVALLLFGLKNRIPSILSTSPEKVEAMSPEQALLLLKDKLDLGIITEEEYQAQRAEIISKL